MNFVRILPGIQVSLTVCNMATMTNLEDANLCNVILKPETVMIAIVADYIKSNLDIFREIAQRSYNGRVCFYSLL